MESGQRSKSIKLTEAGKIIIKEAKAIGIDKKYLCFRDYQAVGCKEGVVWILKLKRKSCVLICWTRHMMTFSSKMKLILVALFAMNW